MTDHERRKRFYLTNHDFQIYVNKGCQTYHRNLDSMLDDPITVAYYESMQKGGCNEERKHHDGTDPERTSEAGSIAANYS